MLIFAADGRGERVIGRAGRGPGEFTAPSDLWRIAGDTLLVPDIANARLNRLHADQPWVEAIPLRTPPDVSPGIQLGGVLPDGRLVVHNVGLGRTGVEDSVVRPPVPVVVLDLASGSAQTIAEVPDLEIVRVETRFRGVTRRMDAALGFGRHAHVVVWDSTIVTGTGDGYALDVRAPDGHVLHRLRLQQTRRQVTAAMRDAYVASRLARFDAGSFERAVDPLESRRLIQYAPFADSLPPYSALHVTPRGTLWVVDAIAPTDSAWTATAFRRDGAIVGRLHMPGAARPVAFDDERVVVRDEDADGVVTMRVHRIVSAAGR